MEITESKLSSFLALSLISALLSSAVIFLFTSLFSEIDNDINKLVFIAYLSVYISMWVVYFASKNGPKLLRVSTLRRLLLVESKNWTSTDNTENDKIETISMEKAKTSITASAMLVGASLLGVVQAKSGLNSLAVIGSGYSNELYIWNKIIFAGLGFFSSVALVCFILSVDALDCMFNEFKTDELENKFRRYFYKSTIHPKYFGLVSLLTSIIFLNASADLVLGSITIGIIISIGYRHWFPRPQLASDDWEEVSGTLGFWARFIPLVSIPVIVSVVLAT